jgi:pSer/pThr/pTyr-binding forkhead associated (FHA) protein
MKPMQVGNWPPPQAAELVVHTGRLAGTRRPLAGPLTFIGRSAGAELRLDVDGINPLHCLITRLAGGFQARDLETEGGTFVNGQRVSVAQLQHGDELILGTTECRFEISTSTEPEIPVVPMVLPDTEAGEEALRIQAAAVAAQQAALLEEEMRLQQQQSAFTQQQEQLAAHLEDKRRRLVQMADQVQATRTVLQQEREQFDSQAARQRGELASSRAALESERKKLLTQRQRAESLRRRLHQRFELRLAAERLQLRGREQAAETQRLRLQQQWDNLKRERQDLAQARLLSNGEAELGKRQVQAEWEKLWQEVKAWHQDRDRKEADLAARTRALRQREDALGDAQRALGDDRHQWLHRRKLVEQEVQGLESRLISQRHKFNECHAELNKAAAQLREARGEAPPLAILIENDPRYQQPLPASSQPRSPETAHLHELEACINRRAACLDQMADDLADQRQALVEHWQRVAWVQEDWQRAHAAAAADLESFVAALPLQEQALLARQHALEAVEDSLRRRQQELNQMQHHLEAWAARLRVREATWESERDRVLIDIQGREAALAKQRQAVATLRQRWTGRRRQELQQLRDERAACEKLRHEYASLRQECWKRGLAHEQQQRELAEQTLALEEYRQQLVVHAPNAAAVENKLERLRKRWAHEHAAAMRETTEQFQQLHQEAALLQQRGRDLLKVAEELTTREATLVQRQTAWEEQLMQAEAQQERLQQQLQSTQVQRDRTDRHVAELQSEVERLARVLLDETELPERKLPLAA